MERLTVRCCGHAMMAWEHEEKHTTQEWIDMLTDRLAAYEDTGLDPRETEEIAERLNENIGAANMWSKRYYELAADKLGATFDHLRSLVEAEQNGRLVVLPCKVGDTAYRIWKKEASMKPILFNTEMVRAILDGRKTVARRPVKFKPGQNPAWSGYIPDGAVLYGSNNIPAAKAPYRHGDILWVRETCAAWSPTYGIAPKLYYKADGDAPAGIKWHPSIHMPREAARLFLRVTGVRVERLKDITPEQIDAEGCKEWAYSATTGELLPSNPSWFSIAWNNTLKPADLPLYGWEANPWVWVIEFERISKEQALEGGAANA